jgi:hypothetical protein
MMSVLEVDVGTWRENASVSLRQTDAPCASPGTHGHDRKFPDPQADFPARRPLVRLGKYEILIQFGVICLFF